MTTATVRDMIGRPAIRQAVFKQSVIRFLDEGEKDIFPLIEAILAQEACPVYNPADNINAFRTALLGQIHPPHQQ